MTLTELADNLEGAASVADFQALPQRTIALMKESASHLRAAERGEVITEVEMPPYPEVHVIGSSESYAHVVDQSDYDELLDLYGNLARSLSQRPEREENLDIPAFLRKWPDAPAEAVKMVPLEPTVTMMRAGSVSIPCDDHGRAMACARDCYKAMLAASPERGDGRKG